jgi:hypothetical protein
MHRRLWVLPVLALLAATASCDIPGTTPPTPFVFPTPNETLTAVFAPTITPVVAPTSTPTPPPLPTAETTIVTPAIVPPTATAGTLNTRPNGVVVEAGRFTTAQAIDGNLSDWPSLPYKVDRIVFGAANWSGPSDASGTFAVAWDEANLYLAARVVDDVHVQTSTGTNIWRGDEIELQIDTNLASDFYTASLSADDFQIGLSPGDFASNPATDYLWYPTTKAGRTSPATVIARVKTSSGYDLEARIPWSAMGVTPSESARYGFALSFSDNDLAGKAAQQSMVSSVATRKLLNPTTWGTLALLGTAVK